MRSASMIQVGNSLIFFQCKKQELLIIHVYFRILRYLRQKANKKCRYEDPTFFSMDPDPAQLKKKIRLRIRP